MSACPEDTYVMCDMPATPSSEVVVTTVQTVDEPLPATGFDAGFGGILVAAAILLLGTGTALASWAASKTSR